MKDYLKTVLSDKRYVHSINTAETAKNLAGIFGEDGEKAYLAGLVHDCTRETETAQQQSMIGALGMELDDMMYQTPELLHAFSAEYIIRDKFEIYDEAVISAVRYHTTGRQDMSMLEKITFLSDVIEPLRNFPGIEHIRQLSLHDIDEALLAAFDSSIKFLLGKRTLIHPDTIGARNFIVKRLQK